MTTRIFDRTGIIEYIKNNDKKRYYINCIIDFNGSCYRSKTKIPVNDLIELLSLAMIKKDLTIKVEFNSIDVIVGIPFYLD